MSLQSSPMYQVYQNVLAGWNLDIRAEIFSSSPKSLSCLITETIHNAN